MAEGEATPAAAAGSADEVTQGLTEIAKQLVNMADSLPQIKQCMADVKAGVYVPSNAAVVASGGTLPAKIDSTTQNPVEIIVTPKKLINDGDILTVPSTTATSTPAASTSTPATEGEEAPKEEGEGGETPAEEAAPAEEAQTEAEE